MGATKRCFKCLSEKPLSDFYKHSQMSDGRLNKCKECTKADVTKNRLDKLEHYRSFDRQRASNPERVAARKAYEKTPEGKAAVARANQKYRSRNPRKDKARAAVARAIKSGKLKRQPCFICGESAHAHHPDYDRELDVTWLCPEHHKAAHRAAAEILHAAGRRETLHF